MLECACLLLRALILESNGFSPAYLHHNQDQFKDADDLAKFAGPYFLLAWPLYQRAVAPFDDDYLQEIFSAAFKESTRSGHFLALQQQPS